MAISSRVAHFSEDENFKDFVSDGANIDKVQEDELVNF